ncbi:50S ribosomal protein L9 [Patescibacteria group bacterium]|nr:50S ribosomal protein L9 [Patescibacteria group bacterium]
MRVILLQDIDELGKKYEVKEVKNGYARNFLIPQGLVKKADEKSLKWLQEQKETEVQKSEEELKGIQKIASLVDGQEVIISVKVGEEGQLFESITAQKISEKLKEMGFDVKKTQIDLAEPIKELVEIPVKVKFAHNLEVEIRVITTEEK